MSYYLFGKPILKASDMKEQEVQMKDRKEEIEYLRMALAMSEFGVSYEQADLIHRVFKTVEKKKGKFSLSDGVKVFHEWKTFWYDYFDRLLKENKGK